MGLEQEWHGFGAGTAWGWMGLEQERHGVGAGTDDRTPPPHSHIQGTLKAKICSLK